ncbi:uncharacterized protein LOC134834919 [Culicoides brevitarsis]|uniref:uncharacterized protein LOC134834919 n=1 Tax=Culicoides brevitarsis TaxID=469753 RepID=UPI00307B6D61
MAFASEHPEMTTPSTNEEPPFTPDSLNETEIQDVIMEIQNLTECLRNCQAHDDISEVDEDELKNQLEEISNSTDQIEKLLNTEKSLDKKLRQKSQKVRDLLERLVQLRSLKKISKSEKDTDRLIFKINTMRAVTSHLMTEYVKRNYDEKMSFSEHLWAMDLVKHVSAKTTLSYYQRKLEKKQGNDTTA